jgi:hypothetical protein
MGQTESETGGTVHYLWHRISTPVMEKETPKRKPARLHRIYRAPGLDFDPEQNIAELDRAEFFLVNELTYTPDGKLISEKEFDDQGNVLQEVKNEYNEKGELIHHELFSDGVQAENITYQYNEKGKVVEERQNFDEGFPVIRRFVYDEQDRLIELISEDDEGELSEREVYTYSTDFPDKIVKLVKYDEDNKPAHEEESVYESETDEDGKVTPRLKQITARDLVYDTLRRTDYYDAQNREDQIAQVSYNRAGKTTEVIYIVYDESGNVIEERIESVNAAENIEFYYVRDEHGRILEEVRRQKDKILLKINRRFSVENYVELFSFRSAVSGVYLQFSEFEFYD